MSSEQYCLKVSIADKIANLLVLGFSGSGIFSIVKVIFPDFPIASIWWVFLSVLGSAIIFTDVLSLPIPDKDTSAATLMFAGNKETASRAVPSKIIVDEVIESKLISEVSKSPKRKEIN